MALVDKEISNKHTFLRVIISVVIISHSLSHLLILYLIFVIYSQLPSSDMD